MFYFFVLQIYQSKDINLKTFLGHGPVSITPHLFFLSLDLKQIKIKIKSDRKDCLQKCNIFWKGVNVNNPLGLCGFQAIESHMCP